MMGKQDSQMQIVILDIDALILENHLLRKIKNCINFDFIYEKAAPYYSQVGRKSIDPVVFIKMLLIGYLSQKLGACLRCVLHYIRRQAAGIKNRACQES